MIILAVNVRFKQGEIDILAKDGDEIVVVEVKLLSKAGTFKPEDKLNLLKLRKLRLLSQIISLKFPHNNVRVDGVTLYYKSGLLQVEHYKNITSP
jgi:putative endonuclease